MNSLNAMPRGKAVNFSSLGVGAARVELRPPEGMVWKVLMAFGRHSAGANRNSGWHWIDPVGINWVSPTISLASTLPLVLGAMVADGPSSLSECWATSESYPYFEWAAAGAAEDANVRAIVLEYSGMGKLGLG